MRDDILNNKQKILDFIQKNTSKAEMCRFFDCQPKTLETCFNKLGITYQKKVNKNPTYKDYVDGAKKISSSALRKQLFKEGIKEKKCECCGLITWMGKPIPLELHHINGNHYDNRLSNLIILCPNCHSQAHIIIK